MHGVAVLREMLQIFFFLSERNGKHARVNINRNFRIVSGLKRFKDVFAEDRAAAQLHKSGVKRSRDAVFQFFAGVQPHTDELYTALLNLRDERCSE